MEPHHPGPGLNLDGSRVLQVLQDGGHILSQDYLLFPVHQVLKVNKGSSFDDEFNLFKMLKDDINLFKDKLNFSKVELA